MSDDPRSDCVLAAIHLAMLITRGWRGTVVFKIDEDGLCNTIHKHPEKQADKMWEETERVTLREGGGHA